MDFKFFIAATFMILLALISRAQQVEVPRPQLSERHKARLEKIADPVKKLKKYKQYFRQDSLKWERNNRKETLKETANKEIEEESGKALKENTHELKGELSVNPEIINAGKYSDEISTIVNADSTTAKETLNKYTPKANDKLLPDIPLDTSALHNIAETTDSVWMKKSGNVLIDSLAPEEYSNYIKSFNEAKQLKDSASFNYISNKAEEAIENKSKDIESIKVFQEAQDDFEGLKDLPSSFEQPDPDDFRQDMKKKMELLANDQLQGQMEKVEAAQAQLSKLKKKYSQVTNSNDLSTAVKRNSLHGKSFWERLVVAGNFQVQSIKPVMLDASPVVGYRFNKLLEAGFGGHWRKTFSDSITFNIPNSTTGYKAFVSHLLFRNFFGYSEYEQQRSEKFNPTLDKIEQVWQPAWHIGLGRNIKVNKYLTMQMLILYNLIHDPFNPLYGDRWNVKVGIKLNAGELNINKKRLW